jgi:nicotinate dehydrogenase subunit A
MKLNVNGAEREVLAGPDTPLLYALRNDLQLVGPKFGCGQGFCGCCTVLANDAPMRSCLIPVSAAGNLTLVTLEADSTDPIIRALQSAFVTEQAAQCGYCSNGMIMTARALLKNTPTPTRAAICAALDNNLCRCGAHLRIVRAVERAAASLK